jgi:hypothetical protein
MRLHRKGGPNVRLRSIRSLGFSSLGKKPPPQDCVNRNTTVLDRIIKHMFENAYVLFYIQKVYRLCICVNVSMKSTSDLQVNNLKNAAELTQPDHFFVFSRIRLCTTTVCKFSNDAFRSYDL